MNRQVKRQIVEAKILPLKNTLKKKDKEECFCIEHIEIPSNFELTHHDFFNSFPNNTTSVISGIQFRECTLAEFPRAQCLTELVSNLASLAIIDCKLKGLYREDLQGLEMLKELYLRHNLIEKLPKGLFEFAPNLEIISIRNNKIKEIDADILSPLSKLKYFDLSNNTSINAKYDAIKHEGNVTFAGLKQEIEKCDPHKWFCIEMRNEIKNLKTENNAIKKKNESFEKEIANLNKKVDELEKECKVQKAEIDKLKLNADDQGGDFTIIANGKSFSVYKEILIANSPVLARLINANQDAASLVLHDISEKTFEEILKFMRTKNPPGNNVNLIELFAASGRLEMKNLMDITAEMLMGKITIDNAPDIMKIAIKYGNEKLRKKASAELKKNFPDG